MFLLRVSPHPSPQREWLLAVIRSDLQGFDSGLGCCVHPRLRSVFSLLTQEKPPSPPLTRKTGLHTEAVKNNFAKTVFAANPIPLLTAVGMGDLFFSR